VQVQRVLELQQVKQWEEKYVYRAVSGRSGRGECKGRGCNMMTRYIAVYRGLERHPHADTVSGSEEVPPTELSSRRPPPEATNT
jgi:hypothetical protein